MGKNEIIKKWLEGGTPDNRIKNTEEYKRLELIEKKLQQFKAPAYNVEDQLKKVNAAKPLGRQRSIGKGVLRWSVQIAASIMILTLAYFGYNRYINDKNLIKITTSNNEIKTVYLPDSSKVKINGSSLISYNSASWNKERNVNLEGEAFFQVKQGAAFKVNTSQGMVKVLGTEFDVFERQNFFQVNCYEGLVKVTNKTIDKRLKTGKGIAIINNEKITNYEVHEMEPSWLDKVRIVRGMPLSLVFKEIERSFNINISSQGVKLNQLYTGRIELNELRQTLRIITKATNTTFEIKGTDVFIYPA